MPRAWWHPVLLVVCLHGPAQAQADACQGSLNALNRVKEQVNPALSPATERGRQRLETMLHVLETGTRVCTDSYPEIWQYREMVARRLGTADALQSAKIAQKQLEDMKFSASFDPFTPPPLPQPAAQQESQPVRSKWALVVGINKFQDAAVPPLHFASKDAKDFAGFLTDSNGGRFAPSHVTLLSDGEATLDHIREGLGALRVKAGPDDLVVIYISSHGSPRNLDPNGLSYILAADTRTSSPEGLYASSLQMIDLVQQINRDIRARRVVLLLDTCYSGDAQGKDAEEEAGSKAITRVWSSEPPAQAQSSQGYSEALDNLHFGYGRAVITASRASQRSWESEKLHNGYFTYFLLSALRADHNATLDSVFRQVKENVATNVKAEKNSDQTPTSQFSDHAQAIVLSVAGVAGQ